MTADPQMKVRVTRYRDKRLLAGDRQIATWLDPKAAEALDILVHTHGTIEAAITFALIQATESVVTEL